MKKPGLERAPGFFVGGDRPEPSSNVRARSRRGRPFAGQSGSALGALVVLPAACAMRCLLRGQRECANRERVSAAGGVYRPRNPRASPLWQVRDAACTRAARGAAAFASRSPGAAYGRCGFR
jgi:hypothetical protein